MSKTATSCFILITKRPSAVKLNRPTTRDIGIAIVPVYPSVQNTSYCVKTAEHIIECFSAPEKPRLHDLQAT